MLPGIFISNAGGESIETVYESPALNGGPDRPYNQFYAAMKEWQRYEIVTSPADADLVFQISWTLGNGGLELPMFGLLRVTIIDPKTHVTLWSFVERVRDATRLGNRDKNFDKAMNALLKRIKAVAEIPAGDAAVRQDPPR